MVIWITGLSASGKTTLASSLTKALQVKGYLVVMLDGDVLREVLGEQMTYSRTDRLELAHKYSRIAKMISGQGIITIIATIALFKEIHLWNRENIPGYFEIYLKVPIDELRRRDPKGIYRRFDAGEIKNVAGLDLPIDEPSHPHLQIYYRSDRSPEDVFAIVFDKLEKSFRENLHAGKK